MVVEFKIRVPLTINRQQIGSFNLSEELIMKVTRGTSKFVKAILLGLILLVATPALTFAQGRGRGRWRDSKSEKKYWKFVNRHDARDGRWDGRGPDRRHRNIYWDRRFRRDRNYDFSRTRRIDWDRDGDFDRFDVLQSRRQSRFQRFERRDRRYNRRW
jgi:hypothetical protein